jgi:hypothetical protein
MSKLKLPEPPEKVFIRHYRIDNDESWLDASLAELVAAVKEANLDPAKVIVTPSSDGGVFLTGTEERVNPNYDEELRVWQDKCEELQVEFEKEANHRHSVEQARAKLSNVFRVIKRGANNALATAANNLEKARKIRNGEEE